MIDLSAVRAVDPELAVSLDNELKRQRDHLELIASENYVSNAVLSAMGSHLTNKYAEGYPAKRYYGGCEWVDVAERLAIERAKALFGAEHANVQPHSGAQANMAVYFSCLSPGDTVVAMSLSHGGHLTHGSPVNMSGKYYRFVPYGVSPKDEKIDYDQLRDIIKENQPKLVVAGASAYTRAIDFEKIAEMAKENKALFLVDMAHISGLVAARLHPDPVPYADYVTTTTHKTLRGPRGGMILCKKEHAKAIDKAIFPGTQGGPLMHTIAAKAVALKEALAPDFVLYQKKILENAKAMERAFHRLNVRMVSGGTDNHMLLLDLTGTGRNGKEMEALLGQAYITVNKNTIPNETLSPFVTSGIRIGTPAVTTRGMTTEDMEHIAGMIARVLREGEDATAAVRDEVLALCAHYPLYEGEVL